MIQLSIIIPVYNVEQYLAKCLDSVLHQNIAISEYEVIVVNDSSPDGSLAIAEEYARKNSNIKIVTRPNGGLSAARNTGLEHALGEYVWFVDSDDWIEENCLSRLLSIATLESLDILCFNLLISYADGRNDKYSIKTQKSDKVLQGKSFVCDVKMPPAAWVALYKRSFLLSNGLKFYESILHEDQEFTPRAYYLANRIMYVEDYVYHYFQRPGGIMKSPNPKKATDLLKVCESLYLFAINNIEKNSEAFKEFMCKINFAYNQTFYAFNKTHHRFEDWKIICYPLQVNRRMKLTDRIKYRIMNLSLPLYYFIYKMAKR